MLNMHALWPVISLVSMTSLIGVLGGVILGGIVFGLSTYFYDGSSFFGTGKDWAVIASISGAIYTARIGAGLGFSIGLFHFGPVYGGIVGTLTGILLGAYLYTRTFRFDNFRISGIFSIPSGFMLGRIIGWIVQSYGHSY
jgi:hypothetical protein